MRVSRAQAMVHRSRIRDEAARRFRERGFDGIGVAELMRSVGLTHGGFYGHFDSKEALMVEACRHAVATMLEEWNRVADSVAGRPLAAVTSRYLSVRHRDEAGTGCLMAALGPEVSRQAAPVRREVTKSLDLVLETLIRLTPGRSPAARRRRALATFASMVGALVIARAVDDPKLSREVLETVAASLPGASSPATGRRRRNPSGGRRR